MRMMKDPTNGLILPETLIDQKLALKKVIDDYIEEALNKYTKFDTYFLTFHGKFIDHDTFVVDSPKVSEELPMFMSNTIVYWVNNRKSFHELLWIVPPKLKGEKLQPQFNTSGVAYLQAKGAMPTCKAK